MIAHKICFTLMCFAASPAFAGEPQCLSRTAKGGIPDVYYFPAEFCTGDKIVMNRVLEVDSGLVTRGAETMIQADSKVPISHRRTSRLLLSSTVSKP